jgi:hypothetical protein
VRQWPFENHTRDCAWHAKNHKWPTTSGTWCRPRCQWGPGPPVNHTGQPDTSGLPRKVDSWANNPMMRRHQKGGVRPMTSLGRFYFLQENNDAILPDAENAKKLRKLYPHFLLPLYTSICLSLNFVTTNCHDTVRHTRPYLDTRGY